MASTKKQLVAVASPWVTLTDAATIATDASVGNMFKVTLGGNRTMGAPSNPVDGQRITYRIIQDANGTRTLTWDSAFRFGTSLPSPTITTGNGKSDIISFTYNPNATAWYCVSIVQGFS